MVIDFSRLNNAAPLTGTARSNSSQEAGSATKSAPATQEQAASAPRAVNLCTSVTGHNNCKKSAIRCAINRLSTKAEWPS
jgi:hypothetical protein